MISVCIATYNGEKFIREQLDSILKQLSEEDEVIISDAGSTDNTLSVVKSLNDKRIKVHICLKKAEYVKSAVFAKMDSIRYNFENALSHAMGDVIFLSDQDDIWMPNKVATVLQALKSSCMVVHDCEVFDGDKTILPSFMNFYRPTVGKRKTFIKPVFMGCCMAFTKDVLRKALPMPNYHIEHDTYLGLCAYKIGKVYILKEPLIRYRRHGMNASFCAEGSRNSLLIKFLRRWYMLKAYFCIK